MMTSKMGTVRQDEVNQKESEQDEVKLDRDQIV